jgi:two-component system, NtrC family, nitrogen regulation response regulator GlnG
MTHPGNAASDPGGVPWVLVVEDDPSLRTLIQEALEDVGLPVKAAVDGWQALGWAIPERPSLVVLELRLPQLDGDEVAAVLRMAHADPVPVVVITGREDAAEQASQMGAFAYLRKPFDMDYLVALVGRALADPSGDGSGPR